MEELRLRMLLSDEHKVIDISGRKFGFASSHLRAGSVGPLFTG